MHKVKPIHLKGGQVILKNISDLDHCFGCGVCISVCPVNIISFKENENGFYSPVIEEQDKCIDCKKCIHTCSFIHHKDYIENYSIKGSYAAWSKDDNIRQLCSSGGVAFEIGRHGLRRGANICSVRYDIDSQRALHFNTEGLDEFYQSIGSKYIPSDITKALSELNPKKYNIIFGTPCQIASIRNKIRLSKKEENFLLVDFSCHGTPSLLLWDKYIAERQKKNGHADYVSWRNKIFGWHDSWNMLLISDLSARETTEATKSFPYLQKFTTPEDCSRYTRGDSFYGLFLGNYCLNSACYSCPLKGTHSGADIRVCDLWGAKYKNDTKGVSGVIALSEKGKNWIDSLSGSCSIVEENLATILEGQLTKEFSAPRFSPYVWKKFQSNLSTCEILKGVQRLEGLYSLPNRILNRVKRLFFR